VTVPARSTREFDITHTVPAGARTDGYVVANCGFIVGADTYNSAEARAVADVPGGSSTSAAGPASPGRRPAGPGRARAADAGPPLRRDRRADDDRRAGPLRLPARAGERVPDTRRRAAPADTSASLASTGADVGTPFLVGLLLLTTGTILLITRRRRTQA
jgi:LPXTG-motif cell wall-anchored protein